MRQEILIFSYYWYKSISWVWVGLLPHGSFEFLFLPISASVGLVTTTSSTALHYSTTLNEALLSISTAS